MCIINRSPANTHTGILHAFPKNNKNGLGTVFWCFSPSSSLRLLVILALGLFRVRYEILLSGSYALLFFVFLDRICDIYETKHACLLTQCGAKFSNLLAQIKAVLDLLNNYIRDAIFLRSQNPKKTMHNFVSR